MSSSSTHFSLNSSSFIPILRQKKGLKARRYGFNGKMKDNEVYNASGTSYDFGSRMYDPRLGHFMSCDPMEKKFAWMSPYAAFADDPINLADEDGNEPIKKQAGTVSDFVTILNNTPSKLGTQVGANAGEALLRLGQTEFSWKQMRPLPTTTPYFNNKSARYIYTEKGGWIDMVHFLFYAGKAYGYKVAGDKNPVGEAVQAGYQQEATDKYAAKYSAYSYEDLPTDKFAADFGANYFDPNSKQTLGEQIQNYMTKVLKATTPEKAPNYNNLPTTEPKDKPTVTNETTTPLFTTDCNDDCNNNNNNSGGGAKATPSGGTDIH